MEGSGTADRTLVQTPPCRAEDRLRQWLPVRLGSDVGPSERLMDIMEDGWASTTRQTYAAGVAAWLAFCDSCVPPIPHAERAPAKEEMVLEFIASCVGAYSGSTVRNYVFGLKAWHTLHRVAWRVSEVALAKCFKAAERAAPPSSKRTIRPPVTVEMLSVALGHLNLSDPLDAAVWACITTTYWSISRLGEFTVSSIDAFTKEKDVKRSDMMLDVQERGATVTTFFLPSTKSANTQGETTQWAAQDGPCDPRAAMLNHLAVNNPAPDSHLFTYRARNGLLRPLTNSACIMRVNTALAAGGLPPVKGHCFRIGGVLEWLLRGVPFEVVKVMGRWSSDAFTVYLRKRSSILAPYIQASPAFVPFTQLVAMPRRIR
ncbi:hypothetical protein DFP72DRAFT_820456 [Ephemerocybe angulata]|uniref:Uncharacterized protein n=1 Tax=Ephemerocybe angulata TaxID=980116 RepID=A0A8H6HJP9_9AGAR|nr:hypothetical protein DFP72DRAFT_820456 [Tulosesus angulatus]